MTALPEFLLAIATRTSPPEQGAGAMTIIVQRPYARLEKELRSTFAGQKGVTVIVDRRCGERRVWFDSQSSLLSPQSLLMRLPHVSKLLRL